MDAPQRMSAVVIEALAALQFVDYEALGLGDLGRPDGYLERQVSGWHRRWQRVLALSDDGALRDELPLDQMDVLQEWLAQRNCPNPAGRRWYIMILSWIT